ncbi:MAG TPA: class I adenylate-forming enzyme family protein [Candidatus Dormibacteraeota bacterium]|nr:class I adenylate-forming enzyme family protein [Candidatus Dormibacteraeota bacterium]
MTGAAPPTQITFLDALEQASRRWPDRVVAVLPEREADPPRPGREMTHEDLWRAATAQADWYRSVGVEPGDRILCAMPNSLEHLVTIGAAWARGAVHVGLDHTLTVPELSWMIEHVGAAALVVQGRRLDDAGLATRVLHVEDAPPAGAGAEPVHPAPEDPAAIIFSSGTTGTPTGSIASHGRFAGGWISEAGRLRFGPDDVHLVQVPLAHGYGLQLAMMGLLTGGRLVLMERFSAGEALRLIAEHGVTVLNGTPSHYIGVLAAMARRPDLGVTSLRAGIGSADHFPPMLLRRIFDELGIEFMNMYGSNMGFGVTTTDRELMLRGSVGRVPPGAVAIVDQAHVPLPVGEVGEIAFRYRPGEAGVWQASRALDQAKRWYYTGDLGRLDAEGHLYLAGRVKHQVNRGGMKIDPAEVLNELFGCEGVGDAAVIGIPDAFLGEAVCACVVPTFPDRPPTLEGLRRTLGERLAPHKLPEELYLVAEIPRTVNGKVEIAALRERAAAASARRPREAGWTPRPVEPEPSPPAPESPVDLEALAAAIPEFGLRLEELRAGLPGLLPVVLDEIVGLAAGYAREGSTLPEAPTRIGGLLRPALVPANQGLADAFQRLAARKAAVPKGGDRQVSFPEVIRTLSEGMLELSRSLSLPERHVQRLLLGCALRRLVPSEHLPRGRELSLVAIVLAGLARLQSDTVLYLGRPEFLTDELLRALQDEAVESRSEALVIHHWCVADLGPAALRFVESEGLRTLVSRLAGPTAPTGHGKYVYCDEDLSGVGVHLHTQPFAVNVELKLAHEHPAGEPGQLVLWPPYAEQQRFEVWPGEMVLWFNGGVPHTREEPSPGEKMTAVSVFFEPTL